MSAGFVRTRASKPLMPLLAMMSSYVMRSSLGRDDLLAILALLQQFDYLGASGHIILKRLRLRVVIDQKLLQAVRFVDRRIGANLVEDRNIQTCGDIPQGIQ